MPSRHYLYKKRKGLLYSMKYIQKYYVYLLIIIFIILSYNLYFIYLIPHANIQYLIYLDVVIIILITMFLLIDFFKEIHLQDKKKEYLNSKEIIASQFDRYENIDIAYHDITILQEQLNTQYQANYDLQDYIAKWCHEMKIPLSASLLMNQKNSHFQQKEDMQEQLEKMNQYLNQVLIITRIQSQLYDINMKPVSLRDCVYQSLKNNRFFFIKKHFEINVQVEDVQVYSDQTWLVYILDQIMSNAIKYAKESPCLKVWIQQQEKDIDLWIEDNGEGIQTQDLPRIFDKGYTGMNHHNGQYKSTGMGLYMVKKMISQLGHQIEIESEYQKYTRVKISFQDQRDYFYR